MVYDETIELQSPLSFMTAPPNIDDRNRTRFREPRNLPYKDAPGFMASLYYWWWAFLQRNTAYIDVDFSLPAKRVTRCLDQIIEWRGKPAMIRVDNGPEYVSSKLMNWAEKHRITLCYIQPGKPQQNAYGYLPSRTLW